MMTSLPRPPARSRLPLALVLTAVTATLPAGCVTEYPLENGLMSFSVTFAASTPGQVAGSEEDRLTYVAGAECTTSCPSGQVCSPAGQCSKRIVLDVEAIGRNGRRFPYRGPVHIRVTPGVITDESDVIIMDKGLSTDVTVHIAQAIGDTHVWLEQDGYLPTELPYGQCSDGIDNDNNQLVDQADPGCQGPDDDLEAPVTMATGVSPTLFFRDPRIRDIQQTPLLATSPLVGDQVHVSAGNLVVTNVISNGFYAVDVADNVAGQLYNGLFVFTFSKPQGLEYGDQLCSISGAVQEHVGMTQLVFPSFVRWDSEHATTDEDCLANPQPFPATPVPEPWELTPALAQELGLKNNTDYMAAVYANSLMLEQYEGNLVRFADLEVSDRFIACDANGNGMIDSATPEYGCRSDCQDDPLCSDLEGYFQYAQYAAVTAGKKKVYASVALADQFEPVSIPFLGADDETGRCTHAVTDDGFLEYTCTPLSLASLSGSLRHIFLCGDGSDESKCDLQFWVIDPRYDGDVVVADTP